MALEVALAQIAPVWLDRGATLEKIIATLEQAAQRGAHLVVFGEALLPGYPFWPELTDGARFDDDVQKDLFAHYVANAVDLDAGHLDAVVPVKAYRLYPAALLAAFLLAVLAARVKGRRL